MLAIGFRTGHRLAEFVAHPSGEVCYLTRGSISYIISGVPCADPSASQLRAMRPGDVILVAPPRSKTDQFGEIHCPFPSAIPFSTDVNSAGFIIREIELTRPCRGAARESTPLFADDRGQPFTHAVMDRLSLTRCASIALGLGRLSATRGTHSVLALRRRSKRPSAATTSSK